MSNHDLLLVIDLQNVYTEGQPWACCHIRQAARNIRRLLDAGVCGEVLFTRFVPPAQPEGHVAGVQPRECGRQRRRLCQRDAARDGPLSGAVSAARQVGLFVLFRFRRCGRPRPGPTGWW